jgi:D-apiose dehydrogenase
MENDRLVLAGADQRELLYDHPTVYQQSFDAAVAHFVARLRSGEPFETDARDNLETLRLVEQAYESSRMSNVPKSCPPA